MRWIDVENQCSGCRGSVNCQTPLGPIGIVPNVGGWGASLQESEPDEQGEVVPAFELLGECETWWAEDPEHALRGGESIDARHRRALVLEALRAYDRLRQREVPRSDPLTVFHRWPVCSLVALVAAAAAPVTQMGALRAWLAQFLDDDRVGEPGASGTTNGIADRWLRGWLSCWRKVVGGGAEASTRLLDVPGVAVLLAASGALCAPQGRPVLRLDVGTGSLCLDLPTHASGSAWMLRVDGETQWAAGDRWHVPGPAREVECTDVVGEATTTIPLVDPADPLLVFDEHGRVVPAGQRLPATTAWLLHEGEPAAEAFDGQRRIVEEAVPPPGWRGWWLGRVALDDTVAVRAYLTRSGPASSSVVAGTWRPVARDAVPCFEPGTPLEWVLDSDGAPVYGGAPRLNLPTAGDRQWTVQVGLAGSTELVGKREVTGAGIVDLADMLPWPALGRFTVTVDQPGSQVYRWTVSIAEGLSVHCQPRLRMLRKEGGIYPASVSVQTTAGMRASPRLLRMGSKEIAGHVELHGPDGSALELRIEPPHVAVRRRTATDTAAWSTGPVEYSPDELDGSTQLELRLPAAITEATHRPVHLVAGYGVGSELQRIDGRPTRPEVYRYNLGRLVDTARQHTDLRLWLDLPGQEVVVAVVRDGNAVAGVLRGARSLGLLDRRNGRLDIAVYSTLAPWLPPQQVVLGEPDSEFDLEPQFLHGPLLVTARRAGSAETVHSGWPYQVRRVHGLQVFRVHGSGVPVVDGHAEQLVVNFLARRTGDIAVDAATLPLLWAAAARCSPELARDCAGRLAVAPVAALFAAADSRLSARELVVPLIGSGLAALRLRQVPDPVSVRTLWEKVAPPELPLPGLLLSSPLLPYLSGAPAWDRDELEPDEDDLLTEVAERCGRVAMDLLTGQERPQQELVVGFGSQADVDRMKNIAPAQRVAMIRSIVPRSPLDSSSRILAMHDAFGSRDALAATSHDVREYVEALRSYAVDTAQGHLFQGIWNVVSLVPPARDERWRLAPALSLGFALVARLAAQGERRAAALERQFRPVWSELAACVPELAAQDVALAEFMVSGWQARDDA